MATDPVWGKRHWWVHAVRSHWRAAGAADTPASDTTTLAILPRMRSGDREQLRRALEQALTFAAASRSHELVLITGTSDVDAVLQAMVWPSPNPAGDVAPRVVVALQHEKRCFVYTRSDGGGGNVRTEHVADGDTIYTAWSWLRRAAAAAATEAIPLVVLVWPVSEDDDLARPDARSIPALWLAAELLPALRSHGRFSLVMVDDQDGGGGDVAWHPPGESTVGLVVMLTCLTLLWLRAHVQSATQMQRALDLVARAPATATIARLRQTSNSGAWVVDTPSVDEATQLAIGTLRPPPLDLVLPPPPSPPPPPLGPPSSPSLRTSSLFGLMEEQASASIVKQRDPLWRAVARDAVRHGVVGAFYMTSYWLNKWSDPSIARSILRPAVDLLVDGLTPAPAVHAPITTT